MRERTFELFSGTLALALASLAWAYGLVQLRDNSAWSAASVACLAGLLGGAALSARLWCLRQPGSLPRLGGAFVVAALLLLPSPGGLLVALVALAAGRGGGLSGPYATGVRAYASVALAVAMAQAWAPGLPSMVATMSGLLGAALLYAWIQLPAVVLAYLLYGTAAINAGAAVPLPWRALPAEWINVPLGWLLAALLTSRAWPEAVALGLALVLAQIPLVKLARAAGDLHRTHEALSIRKVELEMLHTIGREILGSHEVARVCAALDRGCRRIFDHDFCFVALTGPEPEQARVVYRARPGQVVDTSPAEVDATLMQWFSEHKRGLRFGDLSLGPRTPPVAVAPTEAGMRSCLLVPMIVEDRVVGVLSVQSRRPHAYDEHQLRVLTTVAQQAAMALESVRHYEKASVDSLTGFFLREYFFRRLEEEYRRTIRYGGSFSVLMIDLDSFKRINDDHGHMAGDKYLRAAARTIRARLRGADLPCRYGGDEFCLLLPETDVEGARAIAERIRRAVADLILETDEAALRSTVSIGLAAYPHGRAEDAKSVLRNADEALYRAKRAGRDRVVPFAA